MNKILPITFAAALSLLGSSAALASDGVISVNGKVTDASCAISVGGTASPTITLPTVSLTALKNKGDVAGLTYFAMQLTGCPTTGAVRALFEPMSANAQGHLDNKIALGSGGADWVDVQLVNATGTPINLKSSTQSDNTYVTFNADGTATLTYGAQYYTYGDTGAGDVQSQVTYSLEYQ